LKDLSTTTWRTRALAGMAALAAVVSVGCGADQRGEPAGGGGGDGGGGGGASGNGGAAGSGGAGGGSADGGRPNGTPDGPGGAEDGSVGGGAGGRAGAGGGAGGQSGSGGGAGGASIDAGPDLVVSFEDAGAGCGQQTMPIPYNPKTPDVLITFDRSGSMSQKFGTGTRFTTVRDILKPLVSMTEGQIRWGFEEFPVPNVFACPATCCSGLVCHPPGFLKAAEINGAIDTETPACAKPPAGDSCMKACPPRQGTTFITGTTTPSALRVVREFYAGYADGIKDRYALLSTDGEPNCGTGGIADAAVVCPQAVDEIKKLLDGGVKTIVLGVSEEVADSRCLESMALAGGAPRPGGPPSYYPAKDPASLKKSLEEIVAGFARPSCSIDLTSRPPDISKVAVFFDGKQVPWDPTHANGWDYEPPGSGMRIRIYGSPCASLESFKVQDVKVIFGCPPCGGTVSCP